MPTTRHRRTRTAQHSEVVRALLSGSPIARTAENRAELEAIARQRFRESPTKQLPFLTGWAWAELEKWAREH